METGERVPEDVAVAAEKAALKKFWMQDPQYAAAVQACVAAILAERERCAEVVEHYQSQLSDKDGIAAAIRSHS